MGAYYTICKFKSGNESLDLNDHEAFSVPAPDRIRIAPSNGMLEISIPVRILANAGEADVLNRRKRLLAHWLRRAQEWAGNRSAHPVDLLLKAGDALGDLEPLYGRGHLYLRVLGGEIDPAGLVPPRSGREAGVVDVVVHLKCRGFYHGQLLDVADATGWVREVAENGLEVWGGTTNLFPNPCLAYATDWDKNWTAGNSATASQSTRIWRSLGSAAKVVAPSAHGGIFYDDLTLTNAAHVLSAYVHKEGVAPTTSDCELWAGWVYEDFSTAASTPPSPLAEATAGSGDVSVSGGECRLNSSGATSDAAMIYYNSALNSEKIFRISVRGRAASISSGSAYFSRLSDKASAPAVNNPGTNIIILSQTTTGAIWLQYYDSSGTAYNWDGSAWVTSSSAAYAGTVGSTYRLDIISDGTEWYVVLYDSNDNVLTTTDAVTWANTRAVSNYLWWWAGDGSTSGDQTDIYLDYIHIDVGDLGTTVEDEDEEHPGWYRLVSDATTVPLGMVRCGVLVHAGRYVYVDDLQIEAKSYATPFANGDFLGCAWSGTAHDSTTTRTAGKVALDNRNIYADHGSLTLWYKPGLDSTTISANRYLLDVRGASNSNRLALYYLSSTRRFRFYINGAPRNLGSWQSFNAGDEIFIAVTWDFTENEYVLYVNDDAAAPYTTSLDAPVFGTNDIYIGSEYDGTDSMNGTIYDLRIWGDVLSATQVAAIRTAGRGLGELPWLWTASGDGILYNHEDSGHVGSAWLGGVPGDRPAGLKMWVDPTPGEDAPTFTPDDSWTSYYIAMKPLTKGLYQYKFPYVFEAEDMSFDPAGSSVVDADNSGGEYYTLTGDSTATATLAETSQDIFRLHGRWRVFARAATNGTTSTEWRMKISQLETSTNPFAYTRPYEYEYATGVSTAADAYGWIDLGAVDIPPQLSPDTMLHEMAVNKATADYLALILDIDEVSGSSTFRFDCIELLPDEHIVKAYCFAGISYVYYPLLVDTTDDEMIASMVWMPGEEELMAAVTATGGTLRPSPAWVNRLIIRKDYAGWIRAAASGTFMRSALTAQVQPRFEALP